MSDPTFNYQKTVPNLMVQMAQVNAQLESYEFPTSLRHLVELRASQLNQCAYCVKLHCANARADGETENRLDRLVVWRHVDDFTDKEKAALAWTEALTILADRSSLAPLREALKRHFSEELIGALTGMIAQINLWNRIQRSSH